ncbi:hypothetical protein [Pedobacter heparinus]|nr:hypothetical protein [Pedobacter heparinus]
MKHFEKKWIKTIAVMFCFFMPFIGYTQTSQTNIIAPSPTAAALGKYGDMPVSTYTGIPNISIPLYNVTSGSLNLPLSLSYHASGIRVEEEASWCGLGWSLISGGVITRSVRGLDDLAISSGYTSYPDYILPVTANESNDYLPGSNIWSDLYYFRDVHGGAKDAEPDVFYFNFSGHSGKFFINQKANINAPYTFNVESQEKIKISVALTGDKYVWTFITADGTKYIFGTEEKTQTFNGSFNYYEPSPDAIPGDYNPKIITSSWYLDKIISPNGDAIDFVYTAPSLKGSRKAISKSEERIYVLGVTSNGTPGCPPDPIPPRHSYMSSLSIVFDVYLSEINFKNGNIKFNTSDRNDLQPMPGSSMPKKLDNIVISAVGLDGGLQVIKEFEFGYDYFLNSDAHLSYTLAPGVPTYSYSTTYSGKRLKLLSLREKNGSVLSSPYEFSYQTTSYVYGDIPDKYSKSRDHWGFFNNANNVKIQDPISTYGYVSTLLPPYLDVAANKYYTGADRKINEEQITLGMLKDIKYPTGGTTSFVYESNDYSNFPPENRRDTISHVLLAVGELVPPEELEDPVIVGTANINMSETALVNLLGYAFYSEEYCNNPLSPYGGTCSVTIKNTGTTPYFLKTIVPVFDCNSGGAAITQSVSLPAGTYEIKVFADAYAVIGFSATYEQILAEPLLSKKGGGVRILRTIDYDGIDHANDVIKKYKYTRTENNIEKSSGRLMTPLNYEYLYSMQGTRGCGDSGSGVVFEATYLSRSSQSNIAMGNSAQGNPIGYNVVTVLNGENGENGKTVYTYRNGAEELSSSFFPNIPNQPNPGNGYLLNQTDYKAVQGGLFRKVKEIRKEYIDEPDLKRTVKGFRMMGGETIDGAILNGTPYVPPIKFYDSVSEWWHPLIDTVITYDPNDESKFSLATTEYFYENLTHQQLTKTIQSQSDGSKIITKYTYPADYVSINTGTIGYMKGDLHMHNAVIEKVVEKEKDGVTKTIGGTFTNYKDVDGNEAAGSALPAKINVLNLNAPKSSFVSSLATGTAADPEYIQVQSIKYDTHGHTIETTNKEHFTTSYIWGYNGAYPVAEVKNAKKTDVYYNGFEDLTGNSTDSKAGLYSRTGGYLYTISGLSNGTYNLSYWQKSGTSWNNINVNNIVVTGNSYTINLAGHIDEIWFYPENAQMSAYTFSPLMGMTSATDAKGMTTYYEYDSFQRLKYIKDQDGNIVKSYDYHYKP